MSEYEHGKPSREAAAFRAAFAAHAEDGVDALLPLRPIRKPRRLSLAALTSAAACVLALVVVPLALRSPDVGPGDPAASSAAPVTGGTGGPVEIADWQWLSYGDVEVMAPAEWAYGWPPSRPDCIEADGTSGFDTSPYVNVGGLATNMQTTQMCTPEPQPSDMPEQFGELPFAAWSPYVSLMNGAEASPGRWEYQGWTLTRAAEGAVLVEILSPPQLSELADDVLDSVRKVTTTQDGCEVKSAIQGPDFVAPSGAPVPDPVDVESVAVCRYGRNDSDTGLLASKRLSGDEARSLTQAILDAPLGGGPDRPQDCVPDSKGREALVLRFFGGSEATDGPIGVAYVYYASCYGNGIVDALNRYALTPGNCGPLFSAPGPIRLWEGSGAVFGACGL